MSDYFYSIGNLLSRDIADRLNATAHTPIPDREVNDLFIALRRAYELADQDNP